MDYPSGMNSVFHWAGGPRTIRRIEMLPKVDLTPQYFIAAFRRRLWYFVIPFFLLTMAAVVYCIIAPRLYESSSLVLVQPQEVPKDYVRSTVTSDVTSRLDSIRDEIMSRSRLEKIITKHNLYPAMIASADIDDAVKKMRKHIRITFKKPDPRLPVTSFRVSFEGEEPRLVKDVTGALANLFIDFNFRLRAEQASGTTKFLERELMRMKELLRQKEESVRKFKEEHIGYLPEQMQNNYQILTQLQQHLDSTNTVLQKTEDRKVLLQTQLSKLETMRADTFVTEGRGGEAVSLEGLYHQLRQLQSRYSDRHPDVVRLRAIIAKIEIDEQSDTSEPKAEGTGNSTPNNSGARSLMRVQKEDLSAELKMIDKELISLRQEKDKTQSQIEEYRHRIESGPKIEQMFVDLRRDYNQANQNYQSLLQKKLQAELAENLERTQKSEQFKMLDFANLPDKPSKPDIPRILGLGFVLALGCGFGLALLREYIDPTFWSHKEVESALEIPVLVSVPIIQSEKEKRWDKVRAAGTLCVLLIMGSTLLCALFILWKKDPSFLPL